LPVGKQSNGEWYFTTPITARIFWWGDDINYLFIHPFILYKYPATNCSSSIISIAVKFTQTLLHTMKTVIEQVQELILKYDFSKVNFNKSYAPDDEDKAYYDGLRQVVKPFDEVTNQVLHDSFKYFIDINEKRKAPSKLGYSKEGGHPHLPKDWLLPESWQHYLFLAQLNIADFKHLDVENVFPDKGIIYLFQHEEEGKCQIYFLQDEKASLVERKDIENLLEEDMPMAFSGGWIFLVRGDDDYGSGLYKLIPKDLQQTIESLLKAKMHQTSGGLGIEVLPEYWQGENEDWDDEITEITNKYLLYQTDVDDTTIHFWINKEDLKAGNFDQAFQTTSGS
jgi:uncharacterized protein YwqG